MKLSNHSPLINSILITCLAFGFSACQGESKSRSHLAAEDDDEITKELERQIAEQNGKSQGTVTEGKDIQKSPDANVKSMPSDLRGVSESETALYGITIEDSSRLRKDTLNPKLFYLAPDRFVPFSPEVPVSYQAAGVDRYKIHFKLKLVYSKLENFTRLIHETAGADAQIVPLPTKNYRYSIQSLDFMDTKITSIESKSPFDFVIDMDVVVGGMTAELTDIQAQATGSYTGSIQMGFDYTFGYSQISLSFSSLYQASILDL